MTNSEINPENEKNIWITLWTSSTVWHVENLGESMKNENEQENCISCKEVEKALEELENIVREKVDEIDAGINSEK